MVKKNKPPKHQTLTLPACASLHSHTTGHKPQNPNTLERKRTRLCMRQGGFCPTLGFREL